MTNLILNTDSYKASHWVQYPKGTEQVYAYVESRGGKFDTSVFFGMQMWLKKYLSKPITIDNVIEAQEFWAAHGEPFNASGWIDIINKHGGYLPVEIRAVAEGTPVTAHNVLATITNTDPAAYWLPSYLETQMLRALWYPTTVATISWHCKQIIKAAIDKSSDDPNQLAFKLHDFGARGVSSHESAEIGGLAHLVNFLGTDTMEAVVAARRYYNERMAGFSIPAAEHSTITSWGRDGEADAYSNMVHYFGGKGKMVAVVSDSYDIYNATENIWGDLLQSEVLQSGATVVVRPDSGDPIRVPVEIIEILSRKFGYTVNSKGYKVLNPAVRVIQGDGINIDSLPKIINWLIGSGFAIDNLAFGMGGGLLQHCNRDTLKFAMKTSAVKVDGEWRDVYKDPIGDHSKQSKRGHLALTVRHSVNGSEFMTVPESSVGMLDNLLQVVYRDGKLLNEIDFEEVRVNSGKTIAEVGKNIMIKVSAP
jgi:nicotinamide phosphoribosyltransferase